MRSYPFISEYLSISWPVLNSLLLSSPWLTLHKDYATLAHLDHNKTIPQCQALSLLGICMTHFSPFRTGNYTYMMILLDSWMSMLYWKLCVFVLHITIGWVRASHTQARWIFFRFYFNLVVNSVTLPKNAVNKLGCTSYRPACSNLTLFYYHNSPKSTKIQANTRGIFKVLYYLYRINSLYFLKQLECSSLGLCPQPCHEEFALKST